MLRNLPDDRTSAAHSSCVPKNPSGLCHSAANRVFGLTSQPTPVFCFCFSFAHFMSALVPADPGCRDSSKEPGAPAPWATIQLIHYLGLLWERPSWSAKFPSRALFNPVCADSFTENHYSGLRLCNYLSPVGWWALLMYTRYLIHLCASCDFLRPGIFYMLNK